MVIKSIRADDLGEMKCKSELARIEKEGEEKMTPLLKVLEEAQRELVDHIKDSIGMLVDLEFLYELQEFIEDNIANWEQEEIEEEEFEE